MPIDYSGIQGIGHTSPFLAYRLLAEQEAARRAAGATLYGMPQMRQGVPPPPGTPAGGPQPSAPGTSSQPVAPPPMAQPGPPAQAQPGMPQPMPAAPGAQATGRPIAPAAAPQPMPPFRPLPSAPSAAPTAAGDVVAPPPAATDAPAADMPSQSFNVPAIITQLKSQGVPQEKVMDMLDVLAPVMNTANQQELQAYSVHNKALQQAISTYKAVIAAQQGERRLDQGDKKIDQAGQRLGLTRENVDLAKKRLALTYGTGGVSQDLNESGKRFLKEALDSGVSIRSLVPGAYGPGKSTQANAILNMMGEMETGGAGSGEFAGGRADFKANQTALTNVTKDLSSLKPYNDMLHQNGDIAIDLGKKIVQTNGALANRPLNWLQNNLTASPDLAEYLAQIHFVTTEAARVLNNPRLVGQLTDTARKDMQEVISGTMPLESTERVIRRMQNDGERRVSTMEKQREELRGKTRVGAGAPAAAAPAARQTATNPKTGEKVELVNGQWQPVKP